MKLDIIDEFVLEGELKFPLKSLEDGKDEYYLRLIAYGYMMEIKYFMKFNRVTLRNGATVVFRHDILPDREDIEDIEYIRPKITGSLCNYKFQFAAELHFTMHSENDELTDDRKREIIRECYIQVRKSMDRRTIELSRKAEFTLSAENVPAPGEIDHLIEVHARWKETDGSIS